MERRPVVIIGGGPAGAATALFLHARDPGLAREVLVLEKGRHPRPKVCAGGLIPHTLDCLRELGVPLAVPNVVVHHAAVDVPGRRVTYTDGELCRVVRRDEFDHSLVIACRDRGITVREDEKVVTLHRDGHGVRIETERGSYATAVVVGADGSGSRVRRALVDGGRLCVGKAVMCDVPVNDRQWDGVSAARYEFDFLPVQSGVRGYAWVFPCLIKGVPHANVGVYSVDAVDAGARLRRVLRAHLARFEGELLPVQAFPIRWYGEGVRIAAPHALLVGDAAGVDALMGEGISYAFEYGRCAAQAIGQAVATGDFGFGDYASNVRRSWWGKKLRRLELGTRLFYGPTSRLWFALAARSRHVQDIGIRWYNGVDGWDRRSGWDAVRACIRGAPES